MGPRKQASVVRTRLDDCGLILRARRMAQRSRAAAACLPCKANKSKCSDFRPCTRCKRLRTKVCADPHSELSAGTKMLPIVIGVYGNSANSIYYSTTSSIILESHPNIDTASFCGSNIALRKPTLEDLDDKTPTYEQVSSW